jgi:DNA-binding NtrC family response regulator
VAALERRVILEALQGCGQNKQQAAKALGLSCSGLIRRIRRYSIKSYS